MLKLSPRFLLSPRFFALPLIALTIIAALAHASATRKSTSVEVAAPTIRATTCSGSTKVADASCAVARDDTRVVR